MLLKPAEVSQQAPKAQRSTLYIYRDKEDLWKFSSLPEDYGKVEPLVERWATQANREFATLVWRDFDVVRGRWPSFLYRFGPGFDPEELRKNFEAFRWAFERVREELSRKQREMGPN